MRHHTQHTARRWINLLLVFGLLTGLNGVSGGRAQGPFIHPVIMIHGFNSSPSTWITDNSGEGLYNFLVRKNYDPAYIALFAYPPGRGFEEDSCGDIYLIAEKLVADADALSALSVSKGGPAKVDVVAHSLGGLITRQYLADNFPNHKIGTFIDIGTPHSGSAYIDIYNFLANDVVEWLDTINNTMLYSLLTTVFQTYYTTFLRQTGFSWPDPTTPAAQQLDPDSDFIRQLNQPGQSPTDVSYNMLYGDITMRAGLDIFGWNVVSTEIVSIGDFVVSRKNAATIPYLGSLEGPNPPNYHTYKFPAPVLLELKLSLNGIDYEIENIDEAIQQATSVYHGGLIRNQEVFNTIHTILQGNYSPPAPVPTTPPAQVTPPAIISANSSTVLVFDTSGSMGDIDPSGITKLQAAQKAGGNILDIIEAENQASTSTTSQVGVVQFNNSAEILLPLSTDIAAARAALQAMSAIFYTGMPDGLKSGISVLENKPADSKPIIILLSDGLPNVGLNSDMSVDEITVRQQVLDLAAEAGSKGICVYTVGFGDPATGNIDVDFLRSVATTSGCGDYFSALEATSLANVYVDARHASTGAVLLTQDGQIAQDQQLAIASVTVPVDQTQLLYTLNWPGSQLKAVLVDPKGVSVTSSYPGASFKTSSSLASIIVQSPMAGAWQVQAVGVDVPQGTTVYHAVLSVRAPGGQLLSVDPRVRPPQSGVPTALLLLLLAGGGIAIYVLYNNTKRKRQEADVTMAAPPGQAMLVVINPQGGGPAIPLYDGIVIGRHRTCGICLVDTAVSRHHAILRYTQGGWFIQDLTSSGGTFVNGQRVPATRLWRGDKIRIGNTTLEFHG